MGYAERKLYDAGRQMEGRLQAANVEIRRAYARGDFAAGRHFVRLSQIRSQAVERLFDWERIAARASV